MALIVGLSEDFKLRVYPLSESPFVIGRLAKSNVCLKNSQISRRHAQIVSIQGTYYVEDLASANGLFLNDQPIDRSQLTHGDTFNVGGVAHFIFLEKPDPDTTSRVVEKIKSSPYVSPAAYSHKKTVNLLVTEVSRLGGVGGRAPRTSIASQGDPLSGINELELLLQLSYTLNSSLSLTEVLEILLSKVLEIIRAERGFILLKSPRSRDLEVKFARDLAGPLEGEKRRDFSTVLTARCMSEESTVDSVTVRSDPHVFGLVEPRHRNRESLVTPLKVKTSIIGALYVDRATEQPESSRNKKPADEPADEPTGPFVKREKLLFEALCQQAAIAIDNARLTEDLKDNQRKLRFAYDELLDKNTRLTIANEKLDQKVAELAALNAVSRGMNMVSTLDQVLKLILEKTVELLGVEKGSLLLVNEETDTMELRAIVGADGKQPVTKSTRLKVGEGIAGLALRQGIPLAINDGHKNPQFKMLLPADVSIRSLMCVPLVLGNRKIGVINLTNKLSGTGFNENDKTLVTTMASQAAITIENARLYNLAIFDGLTSLHVARYFHLYLEKEIQRVRRYGGIVSLVMADLDHFKAINDTHGHQVGDIVLQKVAQVMRSAVRTNDVASRYGGEEFAIVLPETDLDGAEIFAERLRARIEQTPIQFRDRALGVTVSLGVACYPSNPAQNKTQLISLADRAMMEAKRGGRNRVKICRQPARSGDQPTHAGGPAPKPEPDSPDVPGARGEGTVPTGKAGDASMEELVGVDSDEVEEEVFIGDDPADPR